MGRLREFDRAYGERVLVEVAGSSAAQNMSGIRAGDGHG
jgi:hypothetical protein